MPRSSLVAVAAALTLALPAAASAQTTTVGSLTDPVNQWLPSTPDATWTYEWFDTGYAPRHTREVYTVKQNEQTAFRLAWTTAGQNNPEDAVESEGEIDYRRTDAGLINLNWASTPPPAEFPILCAASANCSNSLSSTHYQLIWGNRSPVLLEPLVRDARWNTVGGANSDVSSANRYLGHEAVKVRAFPAPVQAAVVESELTQAGALGDPYGSGTRKVWWVRGVGPVKIQFRHRGGELTESELVTTNLTPKPLPSDADLMPLNKGDKMRFRWRNSKHMKRWSTQDFTVSQVVNNTARVDVKEVKGPIRVRGAYVFASRLSGVTNISGFTRAVSRAKWPALGPLSQPKDKRRHFFTPFDLMAFGFNPVLPAYAEKGQVWKGIAGSSDHRTFGVLGTSQVLGVEPIRTRLGRVNATVVQSTLTQNAFRFGSGTRTMWFASGKGLVKLVFRHRDGSVSTVERLK